MGDAPEMTFEDAVRRLEAIVSTLESGRGELEESLAMYEEGARLLRRCRQLLDGAERRVEILKRIDENGAPVLAEGRDAARAGSAIGRAGGLWYYFSKIENLWRRADGAESPVFRFDPEAADYGLTGGTVETTAQNADATGAPASRFGALAAREFAVGATAGPEIRPLALSTATPEYGTTVRATGLSAKETRELEFQWFGVDVEGRETPIANSNYTWFKVKEASIGLALKVVAIGPDGRRAATTEIAPNPPLMATRLSLNGPTFSQTISTAVTPAVARASATFQWYRVADDGTETAIEGATAPYYKIKSVDDFGFRIKVVATGGGVFVGSAEATTTYAATAAPLKSARLTLTAPLIGETVRIVADPGAATCSYQWYRVDPASGKMTRIEGATNAYYKAKAEDCGYRLKAYAWGAGNYRGSKAAETSEPVSRVAANAADAVFGAEWGGEFEPFDDEFFLF
ncbi:MAG: exodeoxyribonuclease VII small subunit [Thermoguttaceae bacterium]|nr:exodeoxyribonuclease VII small subunit [Thermoguttaceae bacterium]